MLIEALIGPQVTGKRHTSQHDWLGGDLADFGESSFASDEMSNGE